MDSRVAWATPDHVIHYKMKQDSTFTKLLLFKKFLYFIYFICMNVLLVLYVCVPCESGGQLAISLSI